MKRIIYLMFIAATIFSLISCDDKKDENSFLLGKWTYEDPFFEFDYKQDSITIQMYQGKKITLAIEDIKNMFQEMATDKMGAYFKGVDFGTSSELVINMAMSEGIAGSLRANYTTSSDIIQVKLNADDMKQFMGDKAAMIPAISFKYFQKGNTITLYFDETYIQSIYSNTKLQSQIIEMIIKAMGVDFSTMDPDRVESIKAAIEKSIKDQISVILDNIIKLKVGFVLIRE